MTGYRYFGLVFGRLRAALRLDTVHLPDEGDHAAVWLGVNAPGNVAWVQAGIEIEGYDTHPYAYVEVGADGHQLSLHRVPVRMGEMLTGRLRRRRGRWQASIGPLKTPWVKVPHPTVDACLETLGKASASGRIGHRGVHA